MLYSYVIYKEASEVGIAISKDFNYILQWKDIDHIIKTGIIRFVNISGFSLTMAGSYYKIFPNVQSIADEIGIHF